jgi:hypothetical protein
MPALAYWLLLVPIVLGFLGIALLLWEGVRAGREPCVGERRFHCPKFGRAAIATVVMSGPGGKVLEILHCTALPDPGVITCAKECLDRMQQAPAAAG